MIRKAMPADADAVVDIAVESVSQNPIPVRIDKESMKDMALTCMGNAHFCWVSEVDGEIVAAVAAFSQASFWYERQQCSVLLYYTRVPGEGVKLLREFMRWVKSRPAIKVAVMELEPEADPRLVKILSRIGLDRVSTNVSYIRGLSQ
jgi:hypothetical protein